MPVLTRSQSSRPAAAAPAPALSKAWGKPLTAMERQAVEILMTLRYALRPSTMAQREEAAAPTRRQPWRSCRRNINYCEDEDC